MSLKTVTNKDKREVGVGSSSATTTGKNNNGFIDPNNINPPREIQGKSTVDAPVDTKLFTQGLDIPDHVNLGDVREKGKSYTYNTPAGHVIEYNDAPGNERILIRHTSGTGINLGPDGSVVVVSNERVDLIGEGHTLTAAHGTLTYEGNLTLNVDGDFTVNVGGEYKVNSTGFKMKTKGDYVNDVDGTWSNILNKSKTELIGGNNTQNILGDNSLVIAGDNIFAIGKTNVMASKDKFTMTSEVKSVLTAPDINIAAQDLSVFGDQGTIGGDNIIMYNYNMHTNNTVWTGKTLYTQTVEATKSINSPQIVGGVIKANTVFDGKLKGDVQGNITGTAGKALVSGGVSAVTPVSINVSSPEYNDDIPHDSKATFKPDSLLLKEYIENSGDGVFKINIDPGNAIKQNLDQTEKMGGISDTELTEREIKQELRDPAVKSNSKFIGHALSQSKLSSDFMKPAPEKISYAKSTIDKVITGQTPIGNIDKFKVAKRIKIE